MKRKICKSIPLNFQNYIKINVEDRKKSYLASHDKHTSGSHSKCALKHEHLMVPQSLLDFVQEHPFHLLGPIKSQIRIQMNKNIT